MLHPSVGWTEEGRTMFHIQLTEPTFYLQVAATPTLQECRCINAQVNDRHPSGNGQRL